MAKRFNGIAQSFAHGESQHEGGSPTALLAQNHTLFAGAFQKIHLEHFGLLGPRRQIDVESCQ